MASLLDKTRALREEAWEELVSSGAYAAFKALDEAVARMGGVPKLLFQESDHGNIFHQIVERTAKIALPEGGKRKHGDAAEVALRTANEPLPIGRLLEAAAEYGAEIGGADPLNNFRSTVSKDTRFYPVKRNNMHFWWLADLPLPQTFCEPADHDLLGTSAGSSKDQEGGDGHGPATT